MFRLRALTVAAVIVSMVGASTAAVAVAPIAAVSAPAATAAGSWGTLSVMTGSSAAAAALQSDDDDRRGGFRNPALLSLAIILATIAAAIYILTRKNKGNIDFTPVPISPN